MRRRHEETFERADWHEVGWTKLADIWFSVVQSHPRQRFVFIFAFIYPSLSSISFSFFLVRCYCWFLSRCWHISYSLSSISSSSSPWRPNKLFHRFPRFLQANDGMVGPTLQGATTLSFHIISNILFIDNVIIELLNALLNYTNKQILVNKKWINIGILLFIFISSSTFSVVFSSHVPHHVAGYRPKSHIFQCTSKPEL
jgi:hypothetical protein